VRCLKLLEPRPKPSYRVAEAATELTTATRAAAWTSEAPWRNFPRYTRVDVQEFFVIESLMPRCHFLFLACFSCTRKQFFTRMCTRVHIMHVCLYPGAVSVPFSRAPAFCPRNSSLGRAGRHGDSGGPKLQSGGARLPLRAEPSASRQATADAQGEKSFRASFCFVFLFGMLDSIIAG